MFFFFVGPEAWREPEWLKILMVLDLVRKKYPNMTVGSLRTLLELAFMQQEESEERRALNKIAKRLGIAYTTLARQTDALGPGVGNKSGLNLIVKQTTTGSRKLKTVEFTQDGADLIMEINKIVKSSEEEIRNNYIMQSLNKNVGENNDAATS